MNSWWMLSSSLVIKVQVGSVMLPSQVNLFELSDYVDSSIVEEVGQPEEHYSGDWGDIEKQEDVEDLS